MEKEITAEKLKVRPLRMGIMGGMGSGKSTLAELLGKRWGINPVQERFEENPYLENFYKDYKNLSFRSQICFLALNRKRMKAISDGPIEVFEAPMQNDNLFCQTQYEAGFMDEKERDLYLEWYGVVTQELGITMPDFYIVMDAPPEVLYERIKERGRDFEQREFFKENPDYLEKLVNNVAEWTKKAIVECPVVIVDSVNNNFVDNTEDREKVFEQIENEITVFLSKNPRGKDGVQFIIPDFLKVK